MNKFFTFCFILFVCNCNCQSSEIDAYKFEFGYRQLCGPKKYALWSREGEQNKVQILNETHFFIQASVTKKQWSMFFNFGQLNCMAKINGITNYNQDQPNKYPSPFPLYYSSTNSVIKIRFKSIQHYLSFGIERNLLPKKYSLSLSPSLRVGIRNYNKFQITENSKTTRYKYSFAGYDSVPAKYIDTTYEEGAVTSLTNPIIFRPFLSLGVSAAINYKSFGVKFETGAQTRVQEFEFQKEPYYRRFGYLQFSVFYILSVAE